MKPWIFRGFFFIGYRVIQIGVLQINQSTVTNIHLFTILQIKIL